MNRDSDPRSPSEAREEEGRHSSAANAMGGNRGTPYSDGCTAAAALQRYAACEQRAPSPLRELRPLCKRRADAPLA
jgi:hypothetical protein